MKKFMAIVICIHLSHLTQAQEIITLPHENNSGTVWVGEEKEYFSDIWQTRVVTNVSVPTMEVFRPENPNGTAVIIAPGGALFALSIDSEGNEVAQWLNKKGITAFVLKYRLVPTGDDGVKEVSAIGEKIGEKVSPVLPLSIADGLAAISEVRTNAQEYGIDPKKIGFMGFSAGGAVTMGVTFNYTAGNRPDFIVPVYPWMGVIGSYKVPSDAPPMLVVCASDDPLLLAPASIDLYSSWSGLGKVVELHMYAKGGHGFGMNTQGLPSDQWIQRFYDWSVSEGIASAQKP